MIKNKLACLVAICAGLQGCAGLQMREAVRVQTGDTASSSAGKIDALRAQVMAQNPTVQVMDRALTSRSTVAAAPEVTLPPVLRGTVPATLLFAGRKPSITEFADRLTQATGIATRIKADVFYAPEGLVPGTKTSTAAASSGAISGGAPTAVKAQVASAVTVEMPANFVGSLPALLDQVAARLQISYRFTPDGFLEFYRLLQVTYTISAPAGSTEQTASVGQTSAAAGQFSATANQSTKASLDASSRLIAMVKGMLTQAAPDPIYNETTGSLLVTDTPSVHSMVSSFIKSENAKLNTEVTFEVKTVRVTQKTGAETAVDLSAVYKQIANKYGVTLGGVPSGANASAGGVQMTWGGGQRFSGSELFVKALQETGSSVSTRTQYTGTTNRFAASVNLTRVFDVIAETSSTSTPGSNTIGVSAKKAQEVVGNVMTLIPTVYGDGALLVDITINDSSLNGPPVPYSFGAAGSQISLQLTDKRSEVIRSRRLLRPGEALVLGGTEVVQYDESRKGMDDGLSIGLTGGRESGNREVTRIYYIITAAVRNAG